MYPYYIHSDKILDTKRTRTWPYTYPETGRFLDRWVWGMQWCNYTILSYMSAQPPEKGLFCPSYESGLAYPHIAAWSMSLPCRCIEMVQIPFAQWIERMDWGRNMFLLFVHSFQLMLCLARVWSCCIIMAFSYVFHLHVVWLYRQPPPPYLLESHSSPPPHGNGNLG